MLWSPQQDQALIAVRDWLRDPNGKPVFRVFGFAGVGKTTLAIEMANLVRKPTAFASFTGKAALMMRRKGCHGASTIHSLIYEVREDEDGNPVFQLSPKSDLYGCGLLIIDEVSMVNEEIGLDLLSFKVPILVLGDPAQLPPVSGEGYFTKVDPDVMLTEVHRQAADNPIIALATKVRNGLFMSPGVSRSPSGVTAVTKWPEIKRATMLAADQIICGTNATRRHLNENMRAMLREEGRLPAGESTAPVWRPIEGDKLICLRNKRDRGLFNGGLWRADRIHTEPPIGKSGRPRKALPGIIYMRVSSLDETRAPVEIEVPEVFFEGREKELTPREKMRFDEFDYGNCITCHKSQGSQWDNVLVRDQGFIFNEFKNRWLYTAITRAAKNLIVAS